eukprot:324081-Pelagomonas_calceolata.AAC.1
MARSSGNPAQGHSLSQTQPAKILAMKGKQARWGTLQVLEEPAEVVGRWRLSAEHVGQQAQAFSAWHRKETKGVGCCWRRAAAGLRQQLGC